MSAQVPRGTDLQSTMDETFTEGSERLITALGENELVGPFFEFVNSITLNSGVIDAPSANPSRDTANPSVLSTVAGTVGAGVLAATGAAAVSNGKSRLCFVDDVVLIHFLSVLNKRRPDRQQQRR